MFDRLLVMTGAAVEDSSGCVAAEEGGALGLRMGLQLIDHCLTNHTNLLGGGQALGFTAGAMWEFINDDSRPYKDDSGAVVSDPGHALEFVGLAGTFLREAGVLCVQGPAVAGPGELVGLERLRSALPLLLETNFTNGFTGRGICKAFDLVSGLPTNTDMPWWSLPETSEATRSPLVACD